MFIVIFYVQISEAEKTGYAQFIKNEKFSHGLEAEDSRVLRILTLQNSHRRASIWFPIFHSLEKNSHENCQRKRAGCDFRQSMCCRKISYKKCILVESPSDGRGDSTTMKLHTTKSIISQTVTSDRPVMKTAQSMDYSSAAPEVCSFFNPPHTRRVAPLYSELTNRSVHRDSSNPLILSGET